MKEFGQADQLIFKLWFIHCTGIDIDNRLATINLQTSSCCHPFQDVHRLAGFVIELSAIYNKQPVKCLFPKCTFNRQVGNEYYLSADFFNRLFKSIFLNAWTVKSSHRQLHLKNWILVANTSECSAGMIYFS